ncbi:hypothetical protein [Nonomuraea candida]|uniref:hypothetical protein n=1 Tax=Nonomuraea candida TaxID=359159 RepID=UPI0005BE19A5|nr:hypothetical protein [Nonomuraea candida]
MLGRGLGFGDLFEVGVLGAMGGGALAGLSRAFPGVAGRSAAGGDPVQRHGLALADLGKQVRWRRGELVQDGGGAVVQGQQLGRWVHPDQAAGDGPLLDVAAVGLGVCQGPLGQGAAVSSGREVPAGVRLQVRGRSPSIPWISSARSGA